MLKLLSINQTLPHYQRSCRQARRKPEGKPRLILRYHYLKMSVKFRISDPIGFWSFLARSGPPNVNIFSSFHINLIARVDVPVILQPCLGAAPLFGDYRFRKTAFWISTNRKRTSTRFGRKCIHTHTELFYISRNNWITEWSAHLLRKISFPGTAAAFARKSITWKYSIPKEGGRIIDNLQIDHLQIDNQQIDNLLITDKLITWLFRKLTQPFLCLVLMD